MSLSGNLSDLALAELFQLLGHSRKSGALEICGEDNIAWLDLRDGGVVRVALAEGQASCKEVLSQAGLDEGSDPARVECCLSEAALAAVRNLLEWRRGEFSFQKLEDLDPVWRGPEGIVLSTPISLASLRGDEEQGGEGGSPVTPEDDSRETENASPVGPAGRESRPVDPPPARRDRRQRRRPSVAIVVDPDLPLLERIKETLRPVTDRVHVFQDGAEALARLKQYLVRGEFPQFVLSTEVRDPLDPLKERGWEALVGRVRSLSPEISVVLISSEPDPRAPAVERVVPKPDPDTATEREVRSFLESLADGLGGRA